MKTDKLYLKSLMQGIVERNDEKSFSSLFMIFYERLVNFSSSYVSSRETAEEIASDVLLKIWNNRMKSDIKDIEAYLFISVKNQSLNYIGSKQLSSIKITQSLDVDIKDIIDPFDPEKELEAKELQYSINLAIDTLPPQCKRVYNLIKDEGFKYKEVSKILGISVRTVETQLVRALKRLDLALTPYMNKKTKKPFESTLSKVIKSLLL